jgi:hypothetical protein
MIRTISAAVAATAVLALAACGGSSSGDDAGVSTAAARSAVERSADVRLTAMPVPEEAADQGLKATFSNATTAARDGQVVLLFVLEDAGVADEVGDLVKSTVPKQGRLISSGNLLVVYAAQGTNHAAAVERAVEAL